MGPAPSSNGRGTRPTAAPPPDASADAELVALLRQLALHARALFGKGSEFASLGWKRLKLRAIDGVFTAVFRVAALAAALTIIVSAALLVVAGLHHAIARWAGADWVGELGGGLLALTLPFLALFLVQWKTRRTMLDKALRRPAKSPTKVPASEPATPVTSRPNGSPRSTA